MPFILEIPTPARNTEEKTLLENIAQDFDLKNPELRKRINEYTKNTPYALTYWRHSSANMFAYSFEDKDSARETLKSYKTLKHLPEPKITGLPEVK